jgi:hypothetical protein
MKVHITKQGAAARAVVVSLTSLTLMLSPLAASAHGSTFDPYKIEYTGPQLVSIVDTDAAPVHCIGLAADTGSYLLMVAGMIAPITACSAFSSDGRQCKIIAPISRGVGQLVAAVAAFFEPDELLGHEFRHCRDRDFHPTVLPFAERAQ